MNWPTRILLACLPLAMAGVVIGLAPGARAQDPQPPAPEPSSGEGQDASSQDEEAARIFRRAHGIETIAWMAGRWQGSALGGKVEEHWMSPAGASMTGMFRLVQKDTTGFHQFMLLEEQQGRTWLRMQHVNPGFVTWEKTGPLVFELVEADAQRAVFQSPDPKQIPSRMTYQVISTKSISVKIESQSTLGGPSAFEALYERATP